MLVQQVGNALVFELKRVLAVVADQEGHRVPNLRVMAADERIHRCEAMDEALFKQEIQRAINRRWRRAAGFGFHPVEQVVGLDRLAGCRHQAQHLRAQGRQPEAAAGAGLFDRVHVGTRIVHVVLGIGARIHASRAVVVGVRMLGLCHIH